MSKIRRIIFVSISIMVLIGSVITMGCISSGNMVQVPDIGNLAPDFQYTIRGSDIGNLAPDFQLDNLDGEIISLRDFLGKPVLVNFWASWCPPCRSEMPFIQDISVNDKWVEEELVVLAIDIGESPSTVKEFIDREGLTFTVLVDTELDVAQEYHIFSIPTTFFIDREGIIQEIKIGSFSSTAEMERSLNRIIQ